MMISFDAETISQWMTLALIEARLAGANGEVPVGAVLVSADGVVLAKNHNRVIMAQDPTAHAEILAIRQGGSLLNNYRLNETIMVCTLEPCLMCYSAMVHARIGQLIYGASDFKAGIFSSGVFPLVEKVYNHKVIVQGGIRSKESSAMLTQFFKVRRGARAVEWDSLENC